NLMTNPHAKPTPQSQSHRHSTLNLLSSETMRTGLCRIPRTSFLSPRLKIHHPASTAAEKTSVPATIGPCPPPNHPRPIPCVFRNSSFGFPFQRGIPPHPHQKIFTKFTYSWRSQGIASPSKPGLTPPPDCL